MKNIIYIVCALTVILVFTISCDRATLDGINENPNSPTDVPISLLLPQAMVSTIHGVAGDAAGEYACLFAEHTSSVHLQRRHPYDVKSTVWARVYATLNDLSIIIEKGSEGGSEDGHYVEVGIAKILFAYTLNVGTDMYGDMPYSEALKGSDIRSPQFDSQESIYVELQNILDDAIKYLDGGTIGNVSQLDLVFNGDVTMWKKVAYGLKARFYNRLSNINPQESASSAIAALEKSFSGPSEAFTFNAYQPGATNSNPWARWQDVEQTYGVSTTFIDVLNKYMSIDIDPRANLWFTKISGNYVGAPPGEARDDLQHTIYSAPSSETVLYNSAPQPLLTFDELKFIESESYHRLGDVDNAYLAYSIAVRAACERVGLNDNEIQNYLTQEEVSPGRENLTLQHIIEQKYISFWMFQSIEAFNDLRRTGIPQMNHPSGTPLRLAYPESEISRNSNTPSNINDVTIYDIPVWWGKQ